LLASIRVEILYSSKELIFILATLIGIFPNCSLKNRVNKLTHKTFPSQLSRICIDNTGYGQLECAF